MASHPTLHAASRWPNAPELPFGARHPRNTGSVPFADAPLLAARPAVEASVGLVRDDGPLQGPVERLERVGQVWPRLPKGVELPGFGELQGDLHPLGGLDDVHLVAGV